MRLAYSVVFAPVFAVAQAIYPLVAVRVLNQFARGRSEATLVRYWSAGITVGVALFGMIGWGVLSALGAGSEFAAAKYYLIPVGFAFASAQILEVVLLVTRLTSSPGRMNAVRLAIVSLEIASSIIGGLLWGAPGVVASILVIGCFKVILAAALWRWRPRGVAVDE